MNAEISRLYAYLANMAANSGYRFVFTSGDRDCVRQLELSGPTSFHLTGEAFDAILQPYNAAAQAALGREAVRLGFRWGGNFAARDPVHFDNGNRKAPGTCAVSSGGVQRDTRTATALGGGIGVSMGVPYIGVETGGEPSQAFNEWEGYWGTSSGH